MEYLDLRVSSIDDVITNTACRRSICLAYGRFLCAFSLGEKVRMSPFFLLFPVSSSWFVSFGPVISLQRFRLTLNFLAALSLKILLLQPTKTLRIPLAMIMMVSHSAFIHLFCELRICFRPLTRRLSDRPAFRIIRSRSCNHSTIPIYRAPDGPTRANSVKQS
jgi:hypothetical protein